MQMRYLEGPSLTENLMPHLKMEALEMRLPSMGPQFKACPVKERKMLEVIFRGRIAYIVNHRSNNAKNMENKIPANMTRYRKLRRQPHCQIEDLKMDRSSG